MKPELEVSFSPSWQGYPAGMSPPDFALWQRYQPLHQHLWQRVYYNVRIGEALPRHEELEPGMKRFVEATSRRRIDVVAEDTNTYWIIELRPSAGPGALGSVLTYLALWEQDPPNAKKTKGLLVTDRYDHNIAYALRKYNVIIHLV